MKKFMSKNNPLMKPKKKPYNNNKQKG